MFPEVFGFRFAVWCLIALGLHMIDRVLRTSRTVWFVTIVTLPARRMQSQRVIETGVKTFAEPFLVFRFLDGKRDFQGLV